MNVVSVEISNLSLQPLNLQKLLPTTLNPTLYQSSQSHSLCGEPPPRSSLLALKSCLTYVHTKKEKRKEKP
jgi:hypothetical protein